MISSHPSSFFLNACTKQFIKRSDIIDFQERGGDCTFDHLKKYIKSSGKISDCSMGNVQSHLPPFHTLNSILVKVNAEPFKIHVPISEFQLLPLRIVLQLESVSRVLGVVIPQFCRKRRPIKAEFRLIGGLLRGSLLQSNVNDNT